MIQLTHVTPENINAIRQHLPIDQQPKLQIGCVTITWPHDGTIATCWPDTRTAAIASGNTSEWCRYTGTPGHADFAWTWEAA